MASTALNTILIILAFGSVLTTLEDNLLSELKEYLHPSVKIDIRSSWTSLRFKPMWTYDHKTFYTNSTHIAIEFQPTEKKTVEVVYQEFKDMALRFEAFYLTEEQAYEPYAPSIGRSDPINADDPLVSNLSVYLLQPKTNGPFAKLRFFIQTSFTFNNLKNIFTGNRIGLSYMNGDVKNIYGKCVVDPTMPKEKQMEVHCKSTNLLYDDIFPYTMYFKKENDLHIFETIIDDLSTNQVLIAQQKLIEQQSELILSKKLLRRLGLIGFHNSDDGIHVEPGVDKPKLLARSYFKHIAIFRDQKGYTNSSVFTEIKTNCKRITNTVFSVDSLGVRQDNLDITTPAYKFIAFANNEVVNYVFQFKDYNKYTTTNVWQAAVKSLKTPENCSYHNDNYYLPVELNEMYLITFTLPLPKENKEHLI